MTKTLLSYFKFGQINQTNSKSNLPFRKIRCWCKSL